MQTDNKQDRQTNTGCFNFFDIRNVDVKGLLREDLEKRMK